VNKRHTDRMLFKWPKNRKTMEKNGMKKKTVLFWILGQMRKRIPALAVMAGAQMGYSLFLVFFALGSRGVVDSAISGNAQVFRAACVRQAALILGGMVCLFLLRHLHEKLRANLERDWKKSLLHGLLHGEYAQVRSYHSVELLNRMNNDVSQVNEGVLTVIPGAAAMVTRLVAAVTVLGVLDGRFTVIVAGFGAIMMIATGLLRQNLKELNKKVSEHDGKVSAFLQEIMEKLLMVQAMDVSQEVENRADVLLDNRYRVQRQRKNISLLTNMGISFIYYGAGFFALVWCGGRLLEGSMSFGSLMAVIQLVNQLQGPFANLSGVLPKYVAMCASAERLMELKQIQGEAHASEENAQDLYAGMRELRAEKLCFSYDREAILSGADFALPKGTFAVITGPSGIGKSTLLKLFLGIYQPDSGVLLIQGNEERVAISRSTRKLFAYVPQGNLLLSGTLRENLTIVNPDATEAEIANALYVSTMDEFASGLPQGLDTVLGENGLGLSEGQAQRLALARAIVSGAPILLLDECTSALDESTEAKVLTRIKALEDRTCIAVTHRPAAVNLCDWRLEVSDGKIQTVRVNER